MKALIYSFLALCIFTNCKKDVDDPPPAGRTFERQFYAEGELRDTNLTIFQKFDYTVGKAIQEPFSNVYTATSTADVSPFGYNILRGGIRGTSSSKLLFYIEFRSKDLPMPGYWTRERLEELFVPGRVFETTGKPGETEIGLFFLDRFSQIYSQEDISTSSKASKPQGKVVIEAVEDYSYPYFSFASSSPIEVNGKRVTLSFESLIGRVVRFGQSVVAGDGEVKNGKAVLFFPY